MDMPWVLLVAGLAGAGVGLPLCRIAESLLTADRRIGVPARIGAAAASAVLFVLVAAVFGVAWESPAYLYLAGAAVILGVVDLAEKRLPNAVVYPSLVVMPVLLAAATAATGAWPALLAAGLGAISLFALYFVLALISPGGIGMGDVKLAAVLGLALGYQGWSTVLVGAAAGFVVGGVVSVIALLLGRATLRSSIPFGPAMLAGAFLGLLAT